MNTLLLLSRRLLAGSVAAFALALAFAPTASAQLTSANAGAYDNTGFYDSSWSNYRVGVYDDTFLNRSFFTFDVASLQTAGPLSAATLQIYNPDGGFGSDGVSETLEIRALDLTNITVESFLDGSAGLDGFAALGDGTLLGSVTVTAASNDGWVNVTLNQSFLDWANSTAATQIVLGASLGSLSSGDTGYNEFLFAGTDNAHGAQLQLTAVPEPATTGLLMALGILVPVALRLRRKPAAGS